MDKKPLIDTNLVTEFGGIEDLESFKAEGVSRHDYTHVPGFSEMRYRRDTDLSRLAKNEIRSKEVYTLDVNCRWYRCASKSGDPDTSRMVAARNQGYRAATKDDIGKVPWLTDIPGGGYIAPDGTIKNAGGDLQLFVCDGQNAARNAMQKKILTEQMVDGMDMAVGGLGAIGKAHKGADPKIEKLGGSTK